MCAIVNQRCPSVSIALLYGVVSYLARPGHRSGPSAIKDVLWDTGVVEPLGVDGITEDKRLTLVDVYVYVPV